MPLSDPQIRQILQNTQPAPEPDRRLAETIMADLPSPTDYAPLIRANRRRARLGFWVSGAAAGGLVLTLLYGLFFQPPRAGSAEASYLVLMTVFVVYALVGWGWGRG